MIKDHEITLKRKPRGQIEFWAYFPGTRAKAAECARDILEALKESGCKSPRVFLNGKKVLVKRIGDQT